ncbi:MAG: cell envelope integrity protein CreD [Gammaproteobacteria bacterium]|nr:cell envelope integrity protein CreD [Gammaproteobacteria bacterium]
MKLAIIAVLVVMLTIPLYFITSKIYERDSYRNVARDDIARSWTGEQKLMGPILVVPYTRVVNKREFDDKLKQYVHRKIETSEELLLLPETLDANFRLSTEVRYRGIYEVPVYSGAAKLSGTLSTARVNELRQRPGTKSIGEPYLSLVIDDVRGITRTPDLNVGARKVAFEPGSKFRPRTSGIHAPIDIKYSETNELIPFAISMDLRGISSFRFAPVGNSNSVNIVSNWPHPRFDGLYLPAAREIAADGFTANWQISTFSTNMEDHALQCSAGDCGALLNNHLGVSLVEPVDIYLQSQRASKYGVLFIGLTFMAFFLFEVLRELDIHPIQYGLVGLALTVFYLILVSLAEHIPFGAAYSIATAACCGLLGFYVSYVLGKIRRGVAFALSIAGLYGVLYIIIQAEDYAFSMGAGLVFTALAATMYFTRNVDWYELSGGWPRFAAKGVDQP